MRVFVRLDKDGNIISAMKVETMGAGLEHAYGWLGEGESVIEIDSPKALEKIDCHEIRELYKVDVAKKKLKKVVAKKTRKKAAKKATKKPRRSPRS